MRQTRTSYYAGKGCQAYEAYEDYKSLANGLIWQESALDTERAQTDLG